VLAESKPDVCRPVESSKTTLQINCSSGSVEVEFFNARTLRVHIAPQGQSDPRTSVFDPTLKPDAEAVIYKEDAGDVLTLRSSELRVYVTKQSPIQLTVDNLDGSLLFSQEDLLARASEQAADIVHRTGDNLYGMKGLDLWNTSAGLLRNGGSEIDAGAQGDGGAPFFFTTRFGVLFDTIGGAFDMRDNIVEFSGGSRQDIEYFAVSGTPLEVLSQFAKLSGRPPMPPKWTLGFLNSQWGSDEKEVRAIVDTYRSKHIPLDAFILDYDWKAWGEDNYGEWRWNSTAGTGNHDPAKFPGGSNGLFAEELRAKGVKLAGILKPRIFVNKPGSTTERDDAAGYATDHHLWYGGEPEESEDARPLHDIDFTKPETRAWFWEHLLPSFKTGMVGWWNDEADRTASPGGPQFYFNNLQFMYMGRALYDGQRGASDLRVWSLNRNFYLGAQRYGYAEWSGDIQTGFASMRYQRMRMLATVDLDEPHWSMDAGGFVGHPSPENYARWIEFATFVPIDRVHGGFAEKRQPWVYGPVAEAAAASAIRLRYLLLPYIYSYERLASETGIGIVRPLFWIYPNDPHLANTGDAWMFGDALLISPVVDQGQSVKPIYLPAGTWFDYFRGSELTGGQVIQYNVDLHTWADIPVFIRKGSILASQPVQDYVDQRQISQVTLDIFPSSQASQFVYYDDDGNTYAYEKGVYFRQEITAQETGKSAMVSLESPTGTYTPALRTYLVRIHGPKARAVSIDGQNILESKPGQNEESLLVAQWSAGHDRYGEVTVLRIAAAASKIVIEH